MSLHSFYKLASVLGCAYMVKKADTYTQMSNRAPGLLQRPSDPYWPLHELKNLRGANAEYYRASNAYDRLSNYLGSLAEGTKQVNIADMDRKVLGSIIAGLQGRGNKRLLNSLTGKQISVDQLDAILGRLSEIQDTALGENAARTYALKRHALFKNTPQTAKTMRKAENLINGLPGLTMNLDKDNKFIANLGGAARDSTIPSQELFGSYGSSVPINMQRKITQEAANSGTGITLGNMIQGKSAPASNKSIPSPKESILRPKVKVNNPNAVGLAEAAKNTSGSPSIGQVLKNKLMSAADIIAPAKSPINIPGGGAFDPSKINVPKAPVMPNVGEAPAKAMELMKLPETAKSTELMKLPEAAKAFSWLKHPASKIGLGAAGIGGLGTLIGSMFNRNDK